jgi:hypothetical protein
VAVVGGESLLPIWTFYGRNKRQGAQMDLGDMQALGSTGALTAQGALGHEMAEGTEVQSKYSPAQYAVATDKQKVGESSYAHDHNQYSFSCKKVSATNALRDVTAKPGKPKIQPVSPEETPSGNNHQ